MPPDEQAEDLSRVLSERTPLGPASADDFHNRATAKRLYVRQNEVDKNVRIYAPVFLIGRRGSGKTAILRGTYPDGQLDVDLNLAVLLNDMPGTIAALELPRGTLINEVLVPLWQALFWAALCARVHSRYCSLGENDCPAAFEFGRLQRVSGHGAATDAALRFLEIIRESAATRSGTNLSRFLDEIQINDVPLWQAREELEQAARRIGCQAVVSIDSLDQYNQFLWDGGLIMSPGTQALQSLYRAASSAGRDVRSIYRIRVSFPAELWHFYSGYSENPLKDFDNQVILHWEGSELIQLAPRRLLLFLQLHRPEEFRALDPSRSGVTEDRWAKSLLMRYLPQTIRNGLMVSTEEPVLPYLLRHTQLLPRHFIQLLNRVFRDVDFRPGSISSDHVKGAVEAEEMVIADGILDAYKVPYPQLGRLCTSIIPRLNLRFSQSGFQEIVNTSNREGLEFSQIIRMFVEAGVIGRVVLEDRKYVKADFEYLLENQLFVTAEDELCLHPLFASPFGCRATKMSGGKVDPENSVPIYPIGSEYEVDDVHHGLSIGKPSSV